MIDGMEAGTSWTTVKEAKGAEAKPHLDWQRVLMAFSGV